MVDPFITPIIALKIALGHAAWAKLVLIYKGMLLSAHGHGLAALAHAAITAAQSVGVVGALQMVAQMLLIIGTVGVGTLAAEEAWGALKAMGDGDHAKALKKGPLPAGRVPPAPGPAPRCSARWPRGAPQSSVRARPGS